MGMMLAESLHVSDLVALAAVNNVIGMDFAIPRKQVNLERCGPVG